MPHKKNPDLFELARAKFNVIKGLPNQLTLLTSNLPSGYHRDLQQAKGAIIESINETKECLEILLLSLPKIKVSNYITDKKKYDYLFTVEALNKEVLNGKTFRDAYKNLAKVIENGKFKPDRKISHKHIGSLGNLGLDKLKEKIKPFLS